MSSIEDQRRFEEALASGAPEKEVPQLACDLRDEGKSQLDLYFLFSRYQQEMSGEDPRYDAIVDTMDIIYGGPWAKGADLFSDQLTEEIIEVERKRRKLK